TIGDYAFYRSTFLTAATIPDTVTTVGRGAFLKCTSLESVHITDLAKWCNISFGNSAANPMCNGADLYLNGKIVKELTIPDSVATIGDYAFCGCKSLAFVTIPDTVTAVGRGAFCGCKSLASVTIPDSVTTIGDYAFCESTSLASVTIPDSVTTIGDYAFCGCKSLGSVTIPDSVTSIGELAFAYCLNIVIRCRAGSYAEKHVTYVDSTYKAKYGTFLSIVIIPGTPFKDVNESDWFCKAVTFVYEKGITSGVSDDMYAPGDRVTRAQFITMLCRAYGIEQRSGDNFDDAGNTWYTGYLAAAKQLQISKGTGNNRFEPDKEITREEMVTLIYNYLKSQGKAGDVDVMLSFGDSDSISEWAKTAVAYANAVGYVSGKGNNTFDPQGNATRAELAQILFNMFS
ncbi:MAG: hypothetical protein E7395_08715, partial [Ruminococcaceae bacterium]|nr:hypothetical protein [Oscillospiraceae bacterium]